MRGYLYDVPFPSFAGSIIPMLKGNNPILCELTFGFHHLIIIFQYFIHLMVVNLQVFAGLTHESQVRGVVGAAAAIVLISRVRDVAWSERNLLVHDGVGYEYIQE